MRLLFLTCVLQLLLAVLSLRVVVLQNGLVSKKLKVSLLGGSESTEVKQSTITLNSKPQSFRQHRLRKRLYAAGFENADGPLRLRRNGRPVDVSEVQEHDAVILELPATSPVGAVTGLDAVRTGDDRALAAQREPMAVSAAIQQTHDQGVQHLFQGRYEEAGKLIAEALRHAPFVPQWQNNLGEVRRMTGSSPPRPPYEQENNQNARGTS